MQEIPVSLPYYAYMLYWFIHAITEIDRCGQRIASPAIFDQQAFITKRFQYTLQLPTAAMQDLDRFVHAVDCMGWFDLSQVEQQLFAEHPFQRVDLGGHAQLASQLTQHKAQKDRVPFKHLTVFLKGKGQTEHLIN